ncbi:MAG: hypothetical protein ABI548_07205 [Polyangiaceae bacterium]
MKTRAQRILFALLAALTIGADVYIVRLEHQYALIEFDEPPFWATAYYAEPWATLFQVVVVVLVLLGLRRAVFARIHLTIRFATAILAIAASLLVAIELGTAVSFDYVDGRFRISESLFVTPRTDLDFDATTDAVCLHADVRGFFTWYLNGIPVHPRLLPLPFAPSDLETKLAGAGGCQPELDH